MTPPPTDRQILSADELTEALRVWLRARREPPEVQAVALVYELTALIALHATTVSQARTLIEVWAGHMKGQVHRLGVGVEHP